MPSVDFVIREHAPFVWRVLLHLGVPRAQLEDASQEALLVVCRQLPGFRGDSSLRTWLFGICRNVARAYARSRRALEPLPEHTPCSSPGQDRALWLKEAQAQLLAALDTLDEEQRSVFVLYELEELSMEEIARTLAAPLSTCYTRLQVARNKVELAVRRQERPRLRVLGGGRP
jgi:RNA polymerase sigma-70 factor, ECF subfamily